MKAIRLYIDNTQKEFRNFAAGYRYLLIFDEGYKYMSLLDPFSLDYDRIRKMEIKTMPLAIPLDKLVEWAYNNYLKKVELGVNTISEKVITKLIEEL